MHLTLYRDIDKKDHKLSNILDPQFKTVSILKNNSMRTVDLLPFQLSSLQTLVTSKNYVSIFPSIISGLSEVGFFNYVYQIFGKTRTSLVFQIII